MLAACAIGISRAHADAVNENRVLRKAGGVSKGVLKNIEVTNIYATGGSNSFKTFNRSGSVKIPKSDGKAKSKVKHSGPGTGLNTKTDGKVKKADVKRNGKAIKYVGKGESEPLPFEYPNHPFMGTARATGKVRGKSVVTTAKLKGKRNIDDLSLKQKVTGTARGKGHY